MPAPPGHHVLIEATERHLDLLLEAGLDLDPTAVRADTPIRRAGTIRAIVAPSGGQLIHVRLSSKEHPGAAGTATLDLVDLDSAAITSACRSFAAMMAAGDADYSVGQDIATGRYKHGSSLAKHAYLRATEEYLAAYNYAASGEDQLDRMRAALAMSATFTQGVKDWKRTIQWAVPARELALKLGDSYSVARAEYLEATGWIEIPGPPVVAKGSAELDAHTRLTDVRAKLEKIVAFHERRNELYDAGLALLLLSNAYGAESRYTEGIRVCIRAQRIFHALHETTREGSAIGGLAWNEWGLGNLTDAERGFKRALELTRADVYTHLFVVSNLAILETTLGRLDDALQLQSEALRVSEALQLRLPVTENLYSLGATYYALGDLEQSVFYLERAARHSVLDARLEFITLRALSTAYRDSGRIADARRTAEEALALSYAEPSRARIQIAIAADDASLGRGGAAIARLDAVMTSPAMRLQDIRAEALVARARVHRLDGAVDAAVTDLNAALTILKSLPAPVDEFDATLELARSRLLQNRLSEADAAANRALTLAQLLRRQTANPELRAQRQEPIRPAYDTKLEILMAMRRDQLSKGALVAARETERLALIAAERSRAQALADYASLKYSGGIASPLTGQLRQRAELYQRLGAKLTQLDYRTDAGDSDTRIGQSRADVAELRRELDSLNARIAGGADHFGGDAAPNPDAWSRWLAQHDPDEVIVEYWVGQKAAYCWTVDRTGVSFFELGPSKPIEEAARAMHAAMRASTSTPASVRLSASAALSELILAPVRGAIATRGHIVVVPDQALAYVSFPALVVKRVPAVEYLVTSHDIEMAPAGWWIFRGLGPRQGRLDARILIVDDPIYSAADERLPVGARLPTAAPPDSVAARGLRRLPSTVKEADAVAGRFPAGAVHRLEGITATRARFLEEPLSDFRYIHVASHGLVDSRVPQLASLVLSEYDESGPVNEPAIRAADLMTLDLRADVVAFSACETALGKDAVGEGAMGLGYAALARGARSVLTSLWTVSDEISAEVMTDFYRALLDERATPARALAGAMRGVLQKRPALDPAFWAAYQLTLGAAQDSGPAGSTAVRGN